VKYNLYVRLAVLFIESICLFNSQQSLTRIHLIILLHKAELFEPLLLGHGVIDEGARLLIRLTSSAADHAIDATVQHVEALLENEISY